MLQTSYFITYLKYFEFKNHWEDNMKSDDIIRISTKGGKTMILTTTPSIEGKKINNYLGIVTGEVITGVNFVKDFFAGIRDFVGGRSQSYEEELIKAKNEALYELESRARQMGANAVVGIDIDYEVLGQNGSMLMVSVSGTAVITD